jgi:hypothetical protein
MYTDLQNRSLGIELERLKSAAQAEPPICTPALAKRDLREAHLKTVTLMVTREMVVAATVALSTTTATVTTTTKARQTGVIMMGFGVCRAVTDISVCNSALRRGIVRRMHSKALPSKSLKLICRLRPVLHLVERSMTSGSKTRWQIGKQHYAKEQV